TEKLILESLGGGRDDHLLARQSRGGQIGQSLAGAGPRFGDQTAFAVDRPLDGLRHLRLRLSRAESRQASGERPVLSQNPQQILQLSSRLAARPAPRRPDRLSRGALER